MNKTTKPFKLEDDPIWKEVNGLAEYMYAKLPDFPDEEKWGTAVRLRGSTAESVLWVSLAVGNPGPTGREYDWAAVRKHVSALKTMYRFAGRQKFIDLDPQIMVRLDKLLIDIDAQRIAAMEQEKKHLDTERQDGLKPWLEKYEIWKQITQEKKS